MTESRGVPAPGASEGEHRVAPVRGVLEVGADGDQCIPLNAENIARSKSQVRHNSVGARSAICAAESRLSSLASPSWMLRSAAIRGVGALLDLAQQPLQLGGQLPQEPGAGALGGVKPAADLIQRPLERGAIPLRASHPSGSYEYFGCVGAPESGSFPATRRGSRMRGRTHRRHG